MKKTLPIRNELNILHNTPISMEYDGTQPFEEWQKKARAKLSELIGLDKYKKCDFLLEEKYVKEHKTYREIKFYFQSEENYFVPCILCIPKKSKFEKPPMMICLQGHGTGMHISLGRRKFSFDEKKIENGDRDFAVQCVAKGYCALAIEQRNFGERGGTPKPNCHEPSMVALLTGRTTVAGRVWDISRAIDVLEENYSQYFDKEKIYCMGNSGGGTATFYAMALEDRIKGGIPSCAFASFEKSIGEKRHCECNYIPNIRNYFDMAEIAGMSAPKPIVIVSGKTDGIFPAASAKAEFKRVKETYYSASANPENCVHVIGWEGHRFYAEPAWKAFEKLTEGK